MGSKPNVLLLFSDQHKASVLSVEGHPDVQTPNLDRLAEEGVRFSRAYSQNAICMPSRCSMFSGLYPRTLGVRTNGDWSPVMDEVVPIQKAFQDAGYLTAAFGKRHLANACDNGWSIRADHFLQENEVDNYVNWVDEQGYGEAFAQDWAAEFASAPKGSNQEGNAYSFSLMATRESELPENMTMEAFSKQRTIEFLKSRKEDGQAFFCWTSFYRPHQPYTPLKRYWDKFDRTRWGKGRNLGDAVAMPETLHEEVEKLPPKLQSWFKGKNRVWRLDFAREDEQLYRDYITAYYALVEEIDDCIGEIMSVLDETGLRENTIVIYTSDHGDFVGSHGMVEKCALGHNVYEDTLRVPLIVSWPSNSWQGDLVDGLAELVDIYPTLLDLCDVTTPTMKWELQGRSFAATLKNGDPIQRQYSVSENWVQAAVVAERFKLGAWHVPQAGFGDMLFDLEEDPLETKNLLENLPDRHERMAGFLRNWEESIPTNLPINRTSS